MFFWAVVSCKTTVNVSGVPTGSGNEELLSKKKINSNIFIMLTLNGLQHIKNILFLTLTN